MFFVVAVSGRTPGVTSDALPWRFQFVDQQDRQLMTLNGKPLVQRQRPESDQSPMTAFSQPGASPPIGLPWPNGRSATQFTLTWCRMSKSALAHCFSRSHVSIEKPV